MAMFKFDSKMVFAQTPQLQPVELRTIYRWVSTIPTIRCIRYPGQGACSSSCAFVLSHNQLSGEALHIRFSRAAPPPQKRHLCHGGMGVYTAAKND